MRSALMEEKKDACDSVADFVDRYCTPNMLIKLRQGVGRLIRCESDTGVVSILDPRAESKTYAARIGQALQMLDLVSLSVQEGDDAENYEDDFKSISAQIDQLSKRITAIRESESEDGDLQARLKEIQDIIDKRRENKDTYDDSIVRQMVECIKVYHDGRLQIILGGGYELEEHLESKLG